ncbi:MAG: spermidine synthase, partial [Pyrinomonadaceae bacterium]
LGARPVAVVGLGAGEIACHGRVDSEWTYYEIDPVVEQVARNPSYFTYLRDCPPKVSVVLGDARLTIRNTLEERYGLIIIDAFNSDAIPTHLLTKEAIADYFRKLAPDGILALHISNRHLNLAPVVGNLAKAAGLTGRLKNGEGNEKEYLLATPATLAVLARKDGDLGVIAADTTWTTLSSNHSRVWSDDYINILGAMKVFQ